MSDLSKPENCPCGSPLAFDQCCEPVLNGERFAPTAEALMRSRYTAFTQANIGYLEKTLAPETRHNFDREANETWARSAQWKGLQIMWTDGGGVNDEIGKVRFKARFA